MGEADRLRETTSDLIIADVKELQTRKGENWTRNLRYLICVEVQVSNHCLTRQFCGQRLDLVVGKVNLSQIIPLPEVFAHVKLSKVAELFWHFFKLSTGQSEGTACLCFFKCTI